MYLRQISDVHLGSAGWSPGHKDRRAENLTDSIANRISSSRSPAAVSGESLPSARCGRLSSVLRSWLRPKRKHVGGRAPNKGGPSRAQQGEPFLVEAQAVNDHGAVVEYLLFGESKYLASALGIDTPPPGAG